jgi:glucosamine 6-phosphate synthetase-like amidotransferase/phosphosugar isomerase protein
MSVKAMMATILRDQLTSRGVHSMTRSDYEVIVELLVERLRKLELSSAAQQIVDKPERQQQSPNI